MNEKEFEEFKKALRKVSEIGTIISEIEIQIQFKDFNQVQNNLDEINEILDYFDELEREIYFRYL